jgi:hypothetical protein
MEKEKWIRNATSIPLNPSYILASWAAIRFPTSSLLMWPVMPLLFNRSLAKKRGKHDAGWFPVSARDVLNVVDQNSTLGMKI